MQQAHPELRQITIRPQQQFSWLIVAALLFGGALAAGNLYSRGAWLFAAALAVLILGLACDRLVFDGRRLQRCGPKAWLLALVLGHKRALTLDELETVSSFVTHRRKGALGYRTVISGGGMRWEITSRQPNYASLIRTLCRALSPSKLDPRSRELRDYWPEPEQKNIILLLRSWRAAAYAPALTTPPRMWRRLANSLALAGQFDAAERYFRLARRQEPRNARLLYELGRCLRLRASVEPGGESHRRKGRALAAAYTARRADACWRLAGHLAGEDAALLERIGESFFEAHRDRLALRYFERALQRDSARLRANIGMAEVALRSGQAARAVHYYRAAARAADAQGETSLAQLAGRQAAYYERLRDDDRFLDAEMARLNLLDHLKWARRGALCAFLAAWLVHLTCQQFAPSMHALSREISATAAIIWISTITASYYFSQRRN
jgi:hypothetical protein